MYHRYTCRMTASPPFRLDVTDPLSAWRAETFWTKEIETLEWLRHFSNFHEDPIDTLVDVGANIGIYSLYWLSLRISSRAVACEPAPDNLALLRRNFQLNEYENRVSVVGEPVYSSLAQGQILVPDDRPGSSGAQFKSDRELSSVTVAKVRTTTLDEIITNSSGACVLKIDVDGLDFEVLKGGVRSLGSGSVKSVLIEATEKVQSEIQSFLLEFNFVGDERFNNLIGHSDERRKREKQEERNRIYSLTSTF